MWNQRVKVEHLPGREMRIVAQREQIGRTAIMEGIAQFRREAPPADREGLGRWALSIPFEDFVKLQATWPGLSSKDQATKQATYRKFLQHSDSLPYRMREGAI